MLTELHIRNFALIDDLRLEIGHGFVVMTGETGAGKSIIVDAISAALGERTGSEVVRTGTDKAVVEAVFDVIDSPKAAAAAAESGVEPEDNRLILSREILLGGRSQCRVNGRPVTASVLREITANLIDIHGQHEHQSLLSVPLHVEMLDSWIGDCLTELKDQARAVHGELTGLCRERDRLRTDERERARLLDLYKFQAHEVEAANLRPGEEDELAAERNRLANAERLFAAAAEIHEALAGEEGGAIDRMSAAAMAAERIAGVDSAMSPFAEGLNAALIGAQEALSAIADYRESVEADPARLEQIEERLDVIRTLKKKYGDTVEDVFDYGRDLAGKIHDLTHSEELSEQLEGRIAELTARLESLCRELTDQRRKAAPGFENAVEGELADLAMVRTKFEVSIQPTDPGPNGADLVEFLISPNPGEPVKPLVKIASGGEMSRIMLALKTVTTRAQVPTLVFDEIDAGIGGRTAQVLGDKLASLSSKCQVMLVTHLPQVAGKAATHVSVDKVVENGRSYVRLRTLVGEDRVRELARMLGSEQPSSAATRHAREMLSLADQGNRQA